MGFLSKALRRKRGVVLFIAAFMLPLIFVIIVSIDTFSKRQQSTRNLLESNLWLSSRSALDQFEKKFTEEEQRWLNPDYLNDLLENGSMKPRDIIPDIFLIDQDFQVVYPAIAGNEIGRLFTDERSWSPDYKTLMKKAETAQYKLQNYREAVLLYNASLNMAETVRQKALALEGLAQSNMIDRNYMEAVKYYRMLKNEFSQVENLMGHPFGLSASLQLDEIGTILRKEVYGRDSLLMTYQMMEDGNWLLSAATYYFFKSELESKLHIDVGSKESWVQRKIELNHVLTENIIPAIKERYGYSLINRTGSTKNIYVPSEDAKHLSSVQIMQLPDSEEIYFGGIRWSMDTLVHRIVLPFLADMSQETGLRFMMLNADNVNLANGEVENIPEESLSFSLYEIPLPWTLVASQPGYEELASDAKKEVIIYGLLLAIIILLMSSGVFIFLIAISRERDLMQLQTEFVHNVSHELKTPLSLIRLYGEALLNKEHLPVSDRREGLRIITKESERLSFMINNILDFSKIDMGKKEFNLQPGNLAEVVGRTLDSYRYHLERKGFETKQDIHHDIPTILFDHNAVEGILVNLLSNAMKFSDKEKLVTVKLKRHTDTICLSVADRGIGIPPDEQSNIFDRFYRVNRTTEYVASGSGLGLTLVKHAVDAHGWQIVVESIPGEGSLFKIIIPLRTFEQEGNEKKDPDH